jgi:outer membrane protein assembly factor BamD (BamD/ComL family)
MKHLHPIHRAPRRAARGAVVAVLLLAAACGSPSSTRVSNGHTVIPIDPARPGDSLFQAGLDLFNLAETEHVAALNARTAGDAATAATDFASSTANYGLARAKFDQLRNDTALCPSPSIRCDNAGYLAGRSSYEQGMIEHDQALVALDPVPLRTAAQGSFNDARDRLDVLLAAFPASAFVDGAQYFGGRARYELTYQFAVGSYADAELFFEASYAHDPNGTWADNALYYDGRCEFEEGYTLVAAGTAALSQAQYDQARVLFGQSIGAESALLARFAASTYRDNAGYYMGRAWLEKPTPDVAPGAPLGTSDAERIANLNNALAALTTVVAATPASTYRPGAYYWRGRTHYNLWFHQAGAIVNTELDLALADFHAVVATSTWRDNALYYAVKSYIHEANSVGACADYADLVANFPSSVYTTRAATALAAAVPPITCP